MRAGLVTALGEIHAQPDQVVPVLINCLNDSNRMVRADSALALANYRTNAKPAIPVLIGLLNDKGKGVSNCAALALKAIDPEAAAEVGLK